MSVKNLLIVGDSFAADWSTKFPAMGWPNLLQKDFSVTNLAQAGCGQYKIYQQLQSVNQTQFDSIIIWHTSPYRIHVRSHPIHSSDILHGNADLIYQDIEHHARHDSSLDAIKNWFDHYYDLEYADFVYALICDKIFADLKSFNGTVINCVCQHKIDSSISNQSIFFNFYDLFRSQARADLAANHFNQRNNQVIYELLKGVL